LEIASGIALASAEPLEEAGFHPPKEAGPKEPGNEVCGSFHRALVPSEPLQDLIRLWLRAWPSAN